MHFRVSKYLDVPVHVHRLINASVFQSVFTLYIVLACFSALSDNVFWFSESKQIYLTMDKKESSKEIESEDKLPRERPSEQKGLNYPLINVDAAPVLIR